MMRWMRPPELHADSAEVPSGTQAFTRDRLIYLEPGAVEADPEHVIALELLCPGNKEGFDPVVEGARHGLAPELSLAIWQRICAVPSHGARTEMRDWPDWGDAGGAM